uniref:Uncharacterized protein n=1 Tax=Arundo donax TaxID=35708 RepID=A0A0A9DXX9_ARUDO
MVWPICKLPSLIQDLSYHSYGCRNSLLNFAEAGTLKKEL